MVCRPQKPYNVLGSLSDQITYPDAEGTVTEGELKELLERVDLGHLLLDSGAAADARVNWEDKLSLGEQQRLAMARIGSGFALQSRGLTPTTAWRPGGTPRASWRR